MEPKLIRIDDTIIINPAFVTRAEWVVETLTPYRAGPARDKGTPDAKPTTTERWLHVYVTGCEGGPYRIRGPVAEAVFAALSRLAPQD